MGKILKVLTLSFVIISIGISTVWVFFRFYKLTYVDKTYGFKLMDQRGWQSVPKQEGMYYTIGTTDGKTDLIQSFFGLSPLTKQSFSNPDEVKKTLVDNCQDNTTENSDIKTTEVTINDFSGFSCSFETKGTNTDKILVVNLMIITKSPNDKYNYVISTSYPKGELNEKIKVENLLNNLYFFN